MLARAPGVLTAVSRTQQPHLRSVKPFVTGERSSRKKGQGASLGFHEHLGPSISLSALPRMGMPPATPSHYPHAHTLREQGSNASRKTHTDGKTETHLLKLNSLKQPPKLDTLPSSLKVRKEKKKGKRSTRPP